MTRPGGAAPAGTGNEPQTTTITTALCTSGLCATALLDGPTNGKRFCSYVTDTLVLVLQPGDIVVIDNLPDHKSLACRMRSRLQECGCSTFRPAALISTQFSRSSRN